MRSSKELEQYVSSKRKSAQLSNLVTISSVWCNVYTLLLFSILDLEFWMKFEEKLDNLIKHLKLSNWADFLSENLKNHLKLIIGSDDLYEILEWSLHTNLCYQ